MKVTVLKNKTATNYFFAPEHYQEAFKAYSQMKANGEIDAFSISF
jgi:hypothetical protein